jgi:hypothetical protein
MFTGYFSLIFKIIGVADKGYLTIKFYVNVTGSFLI